MKIKTMYATFGKLDEARLDLSEGLNVLYGENESGKSTWSAFLRVMLYGISTREKNKAGFLADKEKYAPWSGKPMYGKIEFSWQGKEYVMERNPNRNGILQDAKIVECDTGKVLDIPEPVGETLLGVRREVYERTAFIAQSQIAITGDKTGELEKKICAIATTGEEDVSQKQIIARLEKEKRVLQYHGKGEIPQLEEELLRINKTIEAARREAMELTALHMEIEALREKEEKAAGDIEVAKIVNARRNLKFIEDAEAELVAAKDCLKQHQNKEHITQNQAEEIEKKYKYLEDTARACAECKKRLDEVNGEEKTALPDGPGVKPFVVATICALAVALAAAFTLWYIAPIAIVVFAVIYIVMNHAFYKKHGVKNKKELNRKKEEALRRSQTVAILEEEYKRKEAELHTARENLASLLNMLGKGFSISETDKIIKSAQTYQLQQKELLQRVERLATKSDALKMGRNVGELTALASKQITSEAVIKSEEELTAEINSAREALEVRVTQLAALEERVKTRGELGALEVRKAEIEDKLAEKEKDLQAVDIALETIYGIQTELARKFAPTVEKRAGEIFKELTGEHFKVVRIENADMDLRVAENDASPTRSILELSGGTLDELYLSVRLALCEALLTKEVPILLDDAMINFDDTRMTRMLKFLEKLAKERQILVLSCHLRETKFAKENNITAISLQ